MKLNTLIALLMLVVTVGYFSASLVIQLLKR